LSPNFFETKSTKGEIFGEQFVDIVEGAIKFGVMMYRDQTKSFRGQCAPHPRDGGSQETKFLKHMLPYKIT